VNEPKEIHVGHFRTVLVFARNFEQYREYLRNNKFSAHEYRYVDSMNMMKGFKDPDVVLLPYYSENPVYMNRQFVETLGNLFRTTKGKVKNYDSKR
jgi:hypothetical protein